MNLLDFVNNDAFSVQSMTARANNPDIMPFFPKRAGQLGIFHEEGINTTVVMMERRKGKVSLIPATPRGSIPNPMDHAAGRPKLYPFVVPHFETYDVIKAETVQNLRAFGSTDLETFKGLVDRRGQLMTQDHDATLEYGRIGAIKGRIMDSDGTTVILDLFQTLGITETVYDLDLGDETSDVPGKLREIKQDIEIDLGQQVYDHIHCFCGLGIYNKFVMHKSVKEDFLNYQQGAQQYISDKRKGFTYQEIVFEVYPGVVSGIPFVEDDEMRFFPVGVPGLFVTNYAPGDSVDVANTIGVPRYFRQEMMKFGKGMELQMESNPASWCGQPEVLKKGTTST